MTPNGMMMTMKKRSSLAMIFRPENEGDEDPSSFVDEQGRMNKRFRRHSLPPMLYDVNESGQQFQPQSQQANSAMNDIQRPLPLGHPFSAEAIFQQQLQPLTQPQHGVSIPLSKPLLNPSHDDLFQEPLPDEGARGNPGQQATAEPTAEVATSSLGQRVEPHDQLSILAAVVANEEDSTLAATHSQPQQQQDDDFTRAWEEATKNDDHQILEDDDDDDDDDQQRTKNTSLNMLMMMNHHEYPNNTNSHRGAAVPVSVVASSPSSLSSSWSSSRSRILVSSNLPPGIPLQPPPRIPSRLQAGQTVTMMW